MPGQEAALPVNTPRSIARQVRILDSLGTCRYMPMPVRYGFTSTYAWLSRSKLQEYLMAGPGSPQCQALRSLHGGTVISGELYLCSINRTFPLRGDTMRHCGSGQWSVSD